MKNSNEDTVIIKKSHVFNEPDLRQILKPGKEVHFFPKSIIEEEIMEEKTKLMKIVTEQFLVCYVPVWILDFSPEQKNELILKRKLKIEDFETLHISHLNDVDVVGNYF